MQKDSIDSKKNTEIIEVEVEIFDYFNGLQDLQEKKIKCVGDAFERFSEDALRILRALRFAATLPNNFAIESSTKMAIFELKNLLKHISKERINAEISRLILGKNVTQILSEFKEIFLQEMPILSSLSDSEFKRNITALNYAPNDLEVRLSVLFFGLENVSKTLKSLKFSRKNIANITAILGVEKVIESSLKSSLDSIILDKKSLKKLLLKYEKYPHANIVLKWIEMRVALDSVALKSSLDSKKSSNFKPKKHNLDSKKMLDLYSEITSKNECFYISHLAINGSDILGLFRALNVEFNGSKIGQILNILIVEIIEEKLQNNKEILLKRAREIIESNLMQ
ncbi:hypothetical protein DCO58_00955 [Helicobacter saguini]|uniref:tRNA nucleotidyltransferase/poly(A) polymerase RNA and SrmB- binding domain-containing protein n=1 Tax=Helicobacter saguini TaxID=1548018 RepID=A0A4U8T8F6_9HELI|nr:hypothetical protein [Helicobacter saguini]MWV66289.1 hypothetical protein [Helicobacter saguini]TLD95834.1 hypothetical protein LS64_000230 [Helicobacter saguini]